MATETPNPYQATAGVDCLSEPVHFAGCLSRDDVMTLLRDAPRKSWWHHAKNVLVMVLAIFAISVGAEEFGVPGEPTPAFVWMMVAIFACPAWLWIVKRVSPGHRKRVRLYETVAERATPACGWLNHTCMIEYSDLAVTRMTWDFFGSVMVFPKHLLLPVSTNHNRRVILPWRFFESPSDVRQVTEFATNQIGTSLSAPPSEKDLVEIFGEEHPPKSRLDYETSLTWDKDNWPFESDTTDQFTCEVDFSTGEGLRRAMLISVVVMPAAVIWFTLPFWIAAAGWSLVNFRFFGDWSFLQQHPVSTAFVVLPLIAIVVVIARSLMSSLSAYRTRAKQPIEIRVRHEGIFFSGQGFESWRVWSAVEDIVDTPKEIGWVLAESGEPLVFPKGCFGSDTEFSNLGDVLRSFRPVAG